jgi:peptidoglycan/LPS O-acetylase OafA/YrhL
MLTGFLFCKKIIGSKEKKTTWIEIYIARFLRLAPVYILMLIILALAIGWGVFKDYIDASKCRLEDALSWLLFTIPGAPLLCEYKRTNVMTSGVTWSLTYEWLFYFSLPALAQIIGKKPPLPLLLASIFIASAIAFILPFYPVVYLSFLVGIISGYFDHKHHSQNLEKKLWVGLASIAILIGNGFLNNQTSYTILSVFLIGISFHIFASGNSLAGILKTRTFQTLGLCTYSTYLLHGLALFITLTTVKKIIPDIHTNDVTYWTTIILMSPVLIFFCLLVHISIEFPMIKKTKFVVAYIAAKTRGLRSINH